MKCIVVLVAYELERGREEEKVWNLERKMCNISLENEKVQPSPLVGEGYLYLQRKCPLPGCGSGIQWVKTRPSSTVLLKLIYELNIKLTTS